MAYLKEMINYKKEIKDERIKLPLFWKILFTMYIGGACAFMSLTAHRDAEYNDYFMVITGMIGAGVWTYGAITLWANYRVGKKKKNGFHDEFEKNIDKAFKEEL